MRITLASMVLALCVYAHASTPKYSLREICDGVPSKLYAWSQFTNLDLSTTMYDLSSCPGKARALSHVVNLAQRNKIGRICSPDVSSVYTKMETENFGLHFNYPMPKVAEDFAKRAGYAIVGHCKLDAIKRLKMVASTMEPHMQPLREMEAAKAVLLTNKMSLKETDLFRVAAEIVKRIKSAQKSVSELETNLSDTLVSKLSKFKFACNVAYRPIYQDIISGTIEMINNGYDYSVMGPYLKAHADEINGSESLASWLNSMIICEALKHVKQLHHVHSGMPVIHFFTKHKRGKSLFVYNKEFNSEGMDDQVFVDQSDVPVIKSMVSKSARETQKIVNQIYEEILGSDYSMSDRMIKNDAKFWKHLINFIESKLK